MNNTIQTPIDICNFALKKLGEPFPISFMSPNGFLPERTCYIHYHPSRREVLCANRWKFATRMVKLKFETELAGKYGYSLPNDCLRVWGLSPLVDCTIRGRALFCSEPEITLVYTADEEDVTKFDPIFVEAFVLRLASKICMPLTHSIMLCGKLTNEYNKLITTSTQ